MRRHKGIVYPAVVATLIAATLVLVGPAAASGTTLFVDDDGTCNGNAPCYVTIQGAIDAAAEGNTVFVHNGTYYEQLTIDRDLTLLAEDLDETVLIPGDDVDPWNITADNVTIDVATPVAAATVAAAAAAMHYVDDDGLCDGNSPCHLTVQAGVNAAAVGDTVFVYGGTYAEHVAIGKSLTLQGEDRDLVVIDGGGGGNVIYVSANYVTIRSLTVTNGHLGVYLVPNGRIHHVTVDDTAVTNHTEGIVAHWSNYWGGYHSFRNCLVSGNSGLGFHGHGFSRNTIEGCEFTNNHAGLEPAWGRNTVLTGNLIHDNRYAGLDFDSMRYSTIENNRVWRNGTVQPYPGIILRYVASSNTVRNNAVCANPYGIHANYPPVRNNRVYHNDVEANATQAVELGSNYWDNGYPSGGNYWADYTGVDANFDGIGDTPYTFSGGQDNYPLMAPTIFASAEVTAFTAPLDPVQVGTSIDVSATFTDPDSYYSHSGVWDWGDETTSSAVIDEVTQTATGTHTYTEPGVYTISLTLDDLCGPSATATYQYVVIYDPSAGFVTGGGWIDSPPGATGHGPADLPFYNGHYYELLDTPMFWEAAVEAAAAKTLPSCSSAHLVTITSQTEQDALWEMFGTDMMGLHLGGHQNPGSSPEDGWYWVTGEPWDYTNWADGEPNDDGGQDEQYLHTTGWGDAEWNDRWNQSLGFIVEYEDCGPSGKATFGFVSKYKKGATTPTGNTQFQFRAGDLNFHSDSYEWLVVTGADYAKFKGVGTINGEGLYKFQIWAGDGDPDTFRIRIWTENETTGHEAVIYDNSVDQALGGGSIIIHKK